MSETRGYEGSVASKITEPGHCTGQRLWAFEDDPSDARASMLYWVDALIGEIFPVDSGEHAGQYCWICWVGEDARGYANDYVSARFALWQELKSRPAAELLTLG